MNDHASHMLSWQLALQTAAWVIFFIALARAVYGRKRLTPALILLTVAILCTISISRLMTIYVLALIVPCTEAVVSLSVLSSARRQKRSRLQRGLAALGLVFSVLLLLCEMEFGYFMSSSLTVSAAAQQGARAAALGKDITAAVDNGLTGLETSTTSGRPGYRTITTEYAPNGSSTWSTAAPSPLTSDYQVRVTVTYVYPFIMGFLLGYPASLISGPGGTSITARTITGTAVMSYAG